MLNVTFIGKIILGLTRKHLVAPKTSTGENMVLFFLLFFLSAPLADKHIVRGDSHGLSDWSLSSAYYEEIEFINIQYFIYTMRK